MGDAFHSYSAVHVRCVSSAGFGACAYNGGMRLSAMVCLCAAAALAQKSTSDFLKRTSFEQIPGLALSNDKLELTVLQNGGALANLILRDDPEKISPYWNPSRYAREAGRKFNGFALGHFVCVDGFGPVSPEEKDAGLVGHGEAHTLPWTTKLAHKGSSTGVLTQTVKLPIVQEVFTRTLRMVDGENVIYVQSELESLAGFDRPVNWGEHATIGAPFLEPGVTVVDMPAREAQTRPAKSGTVPMRLKPGKDFTWPMAPGASGKKLDVRLIPKSANSLDHTTCLVDPKRVLGFVTALNSSKRLILGYVFRREDYPWIQSWDNYPADLTLARGMEFATQPYDVPRRETVQTNTMFGFPTYRWLPAKSKIESRYLLFYARAPEGFHKVNDVRLEGGKLVIEDHKARKQITLDASLPL
jgi:hypothetical protein